MMNSGIVSRRDPGARRRKTIAVLVHHLEHFGGGYESHLRSAFERACRALDLNLLVVVGRSLDSQDPPLSKQNVVYDLLSPHSVDGVILLSGGLAPHSGVLGLTEFCQRHRPLPFSSLGLAVPGVPSISVDNDFGVEAVVEHVVEYHERRKVVVIAGPAYNSEAVARLALCRRALARHGCSLGPERVVEGRFTIPSGGLGVREFLQRGVEFDAVIAANDAMAIGALEALSSSGIHVPSDVIVTGFDDIERARDVKPSLTTVRQPLERMAELAIELVLGEIEDRSPSQSNELPVELVTRSSCGCDAERPVAGARAPRVGPGGADREAALLASNQAYMARIRSTEDAYMNMLRSGEQLGKALDVASLGRSLGEVFPAIGVRNAYVALYTDPSRERLEPLVCMRGGEPYKLDEPDHPANRLLPAGAFDAERFTAFVLPLCSESDHWGVAVLEFPESNAVYEMLRGQISAALTTAALHREIVHKTQLHERSTQERSATAERMNSLSLLAGGVAHDLNNVLGPLIALPDVILKELAEPRTSLVEAELKHDLETIKSAALRASQTIKDLLTLGRQGRTLRGPLDLNGAVESCVSVERARFQAHLQAGLCLTLELDSEPLVISGSEPQIVRAISNLIRNAMEAVEGAGRVRVRTHAQRFAERFSGYEAIEPGDYVAVSVHDTGPGVPEGELRRIFEPFYSKKPLGENSGSGLGLAIVHGVVKEHEGFLDVESDAASGTVFTLYFRRSEQTLEPARESLLPPLVSARILVVDDEPLQLRAARRVLTHLGYEVTTVSNGADACELFAAAKRAAPADSPFDLVIMDVLLKQEDGLQVLDRIHALYPGQRAMLASGHAPFERGQLAAERGLVWLVKPYTKDGLARAVQAALASLPLDSPVAC